MFLPKIQASGVKVDGACKQAYDDLHQKHQHAYLIFRISDDDTTIIVEKKGDKSAPYSEFVEVGGWGGVAAGPNFHQPTGDKEVNPGREGLSLCGGGRGGERAEAGHGHYLEAF